MTPVPARLTQLIDAALAPVRASQGRKARIREELTTHLEAVYAEELAHHGNADTAFERTATRFGDPAELAARLQATLSPSARFAATLQRLCSGGLNHARLYNDFLAIMIAYTFSGLVLLIYFQTLPFEARPSILFPAWTLPYFLMANVLYLVLMTATLTARLVRATWAPHLTRLTNLLLLPALPIGTTLGLYGLWANRRPNRICTLVT